MSRKLAKSQILLDWFNVSYRTVFLGVLALLVVGVGAVAYWVHAARSPAGLAIDRAAVKYEAASIHSGNGRWDELLTSARVALAEARSRYDARSYSPALEAAMRSESMSQRVLDMAGGQKVGSSEVRFFRLEGDVRVKRAGGFSWDSADRDLALGVGDQIKTSSSASAQIIYFDGTITTIQPGSLLVIKELYEHPVTKVRKVSEQLNWGEVMASTQRRNVDGSFHEVETEKAAARTAEQGEFRVKYDKESDTASFDVFGGKVEVAGASQKELLTGGERVRTQSSGSLTSKEVLPGVPRLISPPDQRIFVFEDPAAQTTRLSWEKVPGTARYHLLISDGYLFTEPLYDAERVETDVAIDGVTPGEYYWKVSAVSRSGVQGPFSQTRLFRVTTQTIHDTGDITPPQLEITDLVQTGAMLIINGRTEPGAQVWIDNDKVEVSDDGTFYTVLRLRQEGINQLRIVAQDAVGNQEVKTHQAYVETF
jgi:hypothetical protein